MIMRCGRRLLALTACSFPCSFVHPSVVMEILAHSQRPDARDDISGHIGGDHIDLTTISSCSSSISESPLRIRHASHCRPRDNLSRLIPMFHVKDVLTLTSLSLPSKRLLSLSIASRQRWPILLIPQRTIPVCTLCWKHCAKYCINSNMPSMPTRIGR